uniref:Uncharacterized protein n=1 Tax=Globodera rostochiensis TaxID=31243 RepID=A0A914HRS3_GLORO
MSFKERLVFVLNTRTELASHCPTLPLCALSRVIEFSSKFWATAGIGRAFAVPLPPALLLKTALLEQVVHFGEVQCYIFFPQIAGTEVSGTEVSGTKVSGTKVWALKCAALKCPALNVGTEVCGTEVWALK